jgi:hypothetical protein
MFVYRCPMCKKLRLKSSDDMFGCITKKGKLIDYRICSRCKKDNLRLMMTNPVKFCNKIKKIIESEMK